MSRTGEKLEWHFTCKNYLYSRVNVLMSCKLIKSDCELAAPCLFFYVTDLWFIYLFLKIIMFLLLLQVTVTTYFN